jgi:hypothetical protein
MTLIVCPGIHNPQLTESFLQSLANFCHQNLGRDWLIFPTTEYPAYDSREVFQFLAPNQVKPSQASPVLFMAFSAGVVGAIGAARLWCLQGGKVKALIAVDGWGVPLMDNFTIHRVSRDYFTHWSSALLGSGSDSFYAQPPVNHLDLWRSPHTVWGWWLKAPGCRIRTCAAAFITLLLSKYEEM